MSRYVLLDSGPLGLLTRAPRVLVAQEARNWLRGLVSGGARIIVPEIADYEVRRELIRMGDTGPLRRLEAVISAEPDRYLALTTNAMRKAAEL